MCAVPLPERRSLKKRRVIRMERGSLEGGVSRRQAGKGGLGSESSFDLSAEDLPPFVASLFHCWGEGSLLQGCRLRWLKKGSH